MAQSLIAEFGIDRDVVALVGAGGKTTLVFALAEEQRCAGRRVIVTTTTKMGPDQDGGLEVVSPDTAEVTGALDRHGACLVLDSVDGHKAIGVDPGWVDRTWASGIADAIVVEADGARRRKVKAPAAHEPVIPACSTLVVAVMSATAIGGVIADVAHRPEKVAALAGAAVTDLFTSAHAAAVLTSEQGGRKAVPSDARYMVAITGASGPAAESARLVARLIEPVPVVVLPGSQSSVFGSR